MRSGWIGPESAGGRSGASDLSPFDRWPCRMVPCTPPAGLRPWTTPHGRSEGSPHPSPLPRAGEGAPASNQSACARELCMPEGRRPKSPRPLAGEGGVRVLLALTGLKSSPVERAAPFPFSSTIILRCPAKPGLEGGSRKRRSDLPGLQDGAPLDPPSRLR